VSLEVLNLPFVLFGSLARPERAEVSAFSGPGIDLREYKRYSPELSFLIMNDFPPVEAFAAPSRTANPHSRITG